MREDKYQALGRQEAERWVMDRERPGREAVTQGKVALDVLQTMARQVEERLQTSVACPKGADWLLDNLHLLRQVQQGVTLAFRAQKSLPALCAPKQCLRVQQLAEGMLRDVDTLEVPTLLAYLTGIQAVCVLQEEELNVLLCALQLTLLKQVAEGSRTLAEGLKQGSVSQEANEALINAIGRLHQLENLDLGEALERQCATDRVLRQDAIYPRMDSASRSRYRQRVYVLAKKRSQTREDTAQQAMDTAQAEQQDLGSVLFRQTRPAGGGWYVAAILFPALLLSLWISFWLDSWWGGVLLFLPLTESLKNGIDFVVTKVVPPRCLFRLELKAGIPAEGKTLCVIATLLTGAESGQELAQKLERYRLANRQAGENLRFGLLADLPDSGKPMGAEQRQWVANAKAAINTLNERYNGGFFLFFRSPTYLASDGRYMGWERKRGALLELARFLRSVPSGLQLLAGDRDALRGTKFILTLDSDTTLNSNAAKRMIGTMLHPMNRPRIDPKRKVVTQGYGILQPRTAVHLSDSGKTRFARILAGQGGTDPYGCLSSAVYHDLFNRGSFTGKGLLDVEAFHTCLEKRFPDNWVLSHDLLEGAYLHAGFLSDVELTDGFPTRCSSYYKRLHRWVRGDWQAAPWLFHTVKTATGETEPNPLPLLDRWKLFDNLRRSLVPAFLTAALLVGVCCSSAMCLAGGIVALVAILSSVLLGGVEALCGRGVIRRRFHSVLVAGFAGTVVRTAVEFLLLPVQAWVCLTAVCTALWRMLVSKEKLLEWVTAAQSEHSAQTVPWRLILPEAAAGVIAIGWQTIRLGSVLGLLWLFSPLLIAWLDRPVSQRPTVRARDQGFLLHEAEHIWRYFAEHLTAERHYLPPDNLQQFPTYEVADRTSPTNIGMALLSCLAAWELGLAEEEQVAPLLGHMLDSIQKLPKWRGHLYNWYHVKTAQPLAPIFVSTVDSGNLCACLIALSQGLREKGCPELAEQAQALADAMKFRPLYDDQQKLFYIGYDCEQQAFTPGRYDLMASEARLASYVAVARGDVPVEHWASLNRSLVGRRQYCGMVSWTGTMFEYFMPQLLLPAPVGSLLYETLCFAVCAQMDWGAARGIPWGVSESAYAVLDGGDHYRYKAHGIPALAMKREVQTDRVIAPYAAWLALSLVPRAVVRDLKQLRNLGAAGRYGLFEAVDFTPERCPTPRQGTPVQSWMAHHLGMSLIAICNALTDQTLIRYFMAEPAMGAYRELLEEKIPVAAPVLTKIWNKQERWRMMTNKQWEETGTGTCTARPACHLLSNGRYSVLVTSGGGGWSQWGNTRLTHELDGVAVLLRRKDTLYPIFPAGDSDAIQWRFQGNRASFTAQGAFFTVKETVCVSAAHDGELRQFQVQLEEPREDTELILYFQPVLTDQRSYLAHPAFSNLSIVTAGQTNSVLLRKLNGDSEDRVLTVRWNAKRVQWTTNRIHAVNETRCGGPRAGIVLQPCLCLHVPVEQATLRFQLAMTYEPVRQSKQATANVLTSGVTGGSDFTGDLLRQAAQQTQRQMNLSHTLSRLLLPEHRPDCAHARGQESLWPFGISGDDPILAAQLDDDQLEWGVWLAAQHQVLTRLGFRYDLVCVTTPDTAQALRALSEKRNIPTAEGARGGLHLIDRERPNVADILAYADLVLDGTEQWSWPKPPEGTGYTGQPIPQSREAPEWHWAEDGFHLEMHGGLLPLRWSHVLANGQFGWLADEAGTGHLWYGNAHENRITPWQNDPLADQGAEQLLLVGKQGENNLFAARDGLETNITYGCGYAVWEKQLSAVHTTLTAFVPVDIPARVFLLKVSGGKNLKLRWQVTARLSDRQEHNRFVQCQAEPNGMRLRNPVNTSYPNQTALFAFSQPCKVSGDNPYQLECDLPKTLVLVAGVYQTETERKKLESLLQVDVAERALNETKQWWHIQASPMEIQTPEPALNHYINRWALYQTIACRLFARAGLYQCGGGYGFRDQLQDVGALIATSPVLAREQILRCCAHQFEEGDVQHWWHPEGTDRPERGVRTRITDDLLWLPYTVSCWTEVWGLDGLLEEPVSYLRSPVLAKEELERYERPERSERFESVYQHCTRAMECVLARGVGEHGLCRMGTGDWNDGMNHIGAQGWGESVWLTWFFGLVLERWGAVAGRCGDREAAERYQRLSKHFVQQAEGAWDGKWYLRGYDDQGKPFGSDGNAECALDSITQSFAAFAPDSDPTHARQAVASALEQLWDRQAQTAALLTPPFHGLTDPGYIRNYPPGVRENGGQYTHGAIWLAAACYRTGQEAEGHQLLLDLLPERHDSTRYLAEPYVLAGDVCTAYQQEGRGGWSWYTGAAGWYYRVVQEELLGLTLREGILTIRPHLPDSWNQCRVIWRVLDVELDIELVRGSWAEIFLDDVPANDAIDCRQLEGKHHIRVVLGEGTN